MKLLVRTCGGNEYSDFAPYAVINLDEAALALIERGRRLLAEGAEHVAFASSAATFLQYSADISLILGEELWDGGAGVDEPLEITDELYAAFLEAEVERTSTIDLEVNSASVYWVGSSKYTSEEKETQGLYFALYPELFPPLKRGITARYEVIDRGGGKGSLWAYVTLEGEPEFKGSGVSLMSGPLKDIQEYVNKEISHEEVMNRWHLNKRK